MNTEIVKNISDKLKISEKIVAEILLEGVRIGMSSHTTLNFKEYFKNDLKDLIYRK